MITASMSVLNVDGEVLAQAEVKLFAIAGKLYVDGGNAVLRVRRDGLGDRIQTYIPELDMTVPHTKSQGIKDQPVKVGDNIRLMFQDVVFTVVHEATA